MKVLPPFVLLLLILPFCFAAEREVRVAWDLHDPVERVAEYRVTVTPPVPYLPHTVVVPGGENRVTLRVDDSVSSVVTVTAANAQGLESLPSEPLIILPRPTTPGGLRILTIETSDNLREWKPMASVTIEESAARAFFRARIEP